METQCALITQRLTPKPDNNLYFFAVNSRLWTKGMSTSEQLWPVIHGGYGTWTDEGGPQTRLPHCQCQLSVRTLFFFYAFHVSRYVEGWWIDINYKSGVKNLTRSFTILMTSPTHVSYDHTSVMWSVVPYKYLCYAWVCIYDDVHINIYTKYFIVKKIST